MEGGLRKINQFFDHHKQEDSTGTTTPDNSADYNLSGADEISMPSPRKSRRGAKKRVISVPIIDGDGSRSKSEVYPPPDSWSWRKYGQKPIKGSPYPRAYYRCSSSKGCPSRKQVERSRLDPTMLLITYSCDHNHSLPSSAAKQHHPTTPTPTTSSSPITETNASPAAGESPPQEFAVFTYQPDDGFPDISGEFGWFSDVGSTAMIESTTSLVCSTWDDTDDVAVMLPIGDEDQSLFGDLGELPEYSVVFRRFSVDSPYSDGTR